MRYYLGVDGGGSKTHALITDENGRIAGKGQSGNGNHQTGYNTAKANLHAAVEAALQQAGLGVCDIASAVFGLAGADRPADYRILTPLIAEFGLPHTRIVCDTMIALRAGTTRPYGVVLICGTGTNSAGMGLGGEEFQCGGFNYTFGDFGGGSGLAVEAFRTVIRAWDGRESPTLLTEMVLKALGHNTVDELFDEYLDTGKPIPPDLAKLLFQAAAQGDHAALEILHKQGGELGKSACAVIRRLHLEAETFDVVLAGSVLTRGNSPFITSRIKEAVNAAAPKASVVTLTVEPVVGAVWMAMEMKTPSQNATAGAMPTVSPEAYENLRDLADFNLIECRQGV
ncbi:N-acetylglucosamine kinase [Gorillibacterium massiliense]|uniref:N-acetylglucosamine kinase n=1 Tax=Gorillibacterium massiliense TaxID=1280390 RepID=UPI0004B92D87|nr:BadF/BadG/BcrA/BcrD ATPase family protein [Gorillibacterium massiliense]